jgi:hypothetical protein
MRALVPVNRVLCLGGMPGLRNVPGLRRVPGIRGLSDVVRVDLPDSDLDRLRLAVNPATAAFIAPNHPEFFTDWMLDKELSARLAPLMASWATHDVVNGMGAIAQWFWLKNNLIAQIPGAGGAAGRAHSVDWALRGNGVLLHPEGSVGWHADHVAPLFPGVAEMAIEAATQAVRRGSGRSVYIAPVVWKLRFTGDVTAALGQELARAEAALGIVAQGDDLPHRVARAYGVVLGREAEAMGVAVDAGAGYFAIQHRLLERIAARLRLRLADTEHHLPDPAADLVDESRIVLRAAERWLRQPSGDVSEIRQWVRAGRRCLRLTPEMVAAAQWHQEDLAENIKRLRIDWCFGSWRDALHRFLPVPAGPRVAHVRAAPPILVAPEAYDSASVDAAASVALLAELRQRLQHTLDGLLRELAPLRQGPRFANPFLA